MSTKKYDSASVPITRATRWRRITNRALVCVIGVAIIYGALHGERTHNGDVLAIYALLALVVGILYLVRALRQTHELVLTEAGKAAKATDATTEARQFREGLQQLKAFTVVVLVFAGVIWFAKSIINVVQGRTTVYSVHCAKWVDTEGSCVSGGEHTGEVTTFIVHVDQQLVVGLADDAPAPIRLFNCVVADTRNWSCFETAAAFSRQLVMRAGAFSYAQAPLFSSDLHYSSRLHWWLTKISQPAGD
jgi:hypothetical protein